MKKLLWPLLLVSTQLMACPELTGTFVNCRGEKGIIQVPKTITFDQMNIFGVTHYEQVMIFSEKEVVKAEFQTSGEYFMSVDGMSQTMSSCKAQMLTSRTFMPVMGLVVDMTFALKGEELVVSMQASGASQSRDQLICVRDESN